MRAQLTGTLTWRGPAPSGSLHATVIVTGVSCPVWTSLASHLGAWSTTVIATVTAAPALPLASVGTSVIASAPEYFAFGV